MKIFAWISGILLSLLIVLAALYFGKSVSGTTRSGSPALGNYPPLATVEFDDFSQLQILKMDEGRLVDGNPTPPKTGLFSVQSSGSSTSSYSNRFQIETKEINGEITARTYSNTHAPSGLFLLVKAPFLKGALKKSFYNGQLDDHAFGKSGVSNVEFIRSPSTEMQSGRLDIPPMCLQLADGKGGWHTSIGPIQEDKALDDLAVVAFPVWPASEKTLEFRAIIPGEQPETFTLPNPFHRIAVGTTAPKSLPQTHREKDFALTLRSATIHSLPELGEVVTIDYEFENHLPQTGLRFPAREAVFTEYPTLRNQQGQWTPEGHFEIAAGEYEGGFLISADSRDFEVAFSIERSTAYPRALGDVITLGTAKVEADGTTITMLSSEKHLGLKRLTLSPIGKAYHSATTRIEAEFEWKSKKARASAIGSLQYDNAALYLFFASETFSRGQVNLGSGGSGWRGETSTMELHQPWYGELKAGDTLTIGMARVLPVQEVRFGFDRSQLGSR
ncbi:hypothetical protein AAFN60_12860 [Roseibacillus persicicus]|uniref:hypothetical protein n=1 Tax=Roseibacillus persicicus TaxID=454148 RepID=UPI00398B1A1F